MVDVRELLADSAAEHVAEDEQCAGGEHDATAGKGRVDARLAVEHPAHVDAAAAGDAAHVVEMG